MKDFLSSPSFSVVKPCASTVLSAPSIVGAVGRKRKSLWISLSKQRCSPFLPLPSRQVRIEASCVKKSLHNSSLSSSLFFSFLCSWIMFQSPFSSHPKMNSFLFANTHNQVFVFNSVILFLSLTSFTFIFSQISIKVKKRIVSVKGGFKIILTLFLPFLSRPTIQQAVQTTSPATTSPEEGGSRLSEWLNWELGPCIPPPTRNCHHLPSKETTTRELLLSLATGHIKKK